jgi:hypothetical protein
MSPTNGGSLSRAVGFGALPRLEQVANMPLRGKTVSVAPFATRRSAHRSPRQGSESTSKRRLLNGSPCFLHLRRGCGRVEAQIYSLLAIPYASCRSRGHVAVAQSQQSENFSRTLLQQHFHLPNMDAIGPASIFHPFRINNSFLRHHA